MAARLTKAEARALGLDTDAATEPPGKRARRAREQYRSQCASCEVICESYAAEDRHLADTGHARYTWLEP